MYCQILIVRDRDANDCEAIQVRGGRLSAAPRILPYNRQYRDNEDSLLFTVQTTLNPEGYMALQNPH